MSIGPASLDPERLFQPFAGARRLLLAVSGGPDSMALLHLARRWTGAASLLAATVDHGLRPNSAAEARTVGEWAGALGVEHHILVWEGEKPRTRLQERAREARYALLTGLAHRLAADAILTAHHADDQAETVLFRFLRGSGPAGLAGMAPETERCGMRLARPLLAVPKQDLIAVCRDAGQPFFEDSSNLDPRFARARMRRLLAALSAEGLARDDLLRLSARAARAEAALASVAAVMFDRFDVARGESAFACDLAPLRTEPEEFLLRLLVQEVGRVGGRGLRLDRAEALATRMRAALGTGRELKASLGGVILRLDRRGRLTMAPEPPRRAASEPPRKSKGTMTLLHADP